MDKKFVINMVNMFSSMVAAIFLFSGIFIAVFWGFDINLGLSYVFAVLGLSFVFTILYIPVKLSEEWNISKGVSIAINALFFLLVNVIVVITGFLLEWFAADDMKMIIGFEVTIIMVYCSITFISWYSARNIANKMNDRLKEISEK
ncbi:MAG: DUF3021 family protein [Treponema sp.]|nr:DUF3021 family protein [Candidatus Treponema equi]